MGGGRHIVESFNVMILNYWNYRLNENEDDNLHC